MSQIKSNADRLVRSTVKVLALNQNVIATTGSGLLMYLYIDAKRFSPVVVTNKHVVEGADFVKFQIPSGTGPKLYNASPIEAIIYHEDPSIDLCCIPVASNLIDAGSAHDIEFISSTDIYDAGKMKELTALESIIMIGYPNGLIDAEELYPISRRGVTATPIWASLDGNPDFMIDCACFSGSSGSPVFLFDQGSYVDKENNIHIASRFGLLGFLYKGPTLNQKGTVVSDAASQTLANVVNVQAMMNLGICVKAWKIFDMVPKLLDVASKHI